MPRSCGVDGCLRPHKARGYCHAHYLRLWREQSLPVDDDDSTDYPTLAAVVLAVEEAAAGIGGLLEHWPASAPVVEERLRYVYDRLSTVRRDVHVDRVERDLIA